MQMIFFIFILSDSKLFWYRKTRTLVVLQEKNQINSNHRIADDIPVTACLIVFYSLLF